MSRLRFAVLSAFAVVAGCQCPVAGGGGDGGAPFDGGSGGNDGGGGSDGGSDGGTGGGGGGSRTDGGSFGGGGTPLAVDGGAGGSGTNVVLLPDGGVALGTSAESYTYMWIANNAQGWVSKYDTRTAKEVARYFSVIPKDCSNSPGGPPCAGGAPHDLRADRTHFPSRTAIDIAGDMWVANRAMLTTASVTKIANELSRCVDRNGNGRIDTSSDRNGDGEISRDPAAGEFIVPTDFADVRHYDECVLFTQPLDGPVPQGGVGARAIAVSAGFEGGGAGDVWVGIFHTKRIYRLDSSTGVPVAVNSSGAQFLELGFGAYGAIVDRSQRLWVVQSGTPRLALIDTLAGSIVDDNIRAPDASRCGAYALSVDGKGRVWLPGMYAGARACRYDPSTSQWQDFDFSAARSARGTVFTYGRGIAVDVDGKVYMSGTGLREGSPLAWQWQAQLIRFDAETGAILPFGTQEFIDVTNPTSTYASIGVGLDIDGHPWVNNQSGNAMKVDKNTGAVTFTPQQPEGLYTYSDFTGYVLRNYTAPRGTYRNTLTGCGPNAEWTTLRWSATVPTGTALEARVWTATTRAGLDVPGVVVKGPFSSSPVDLRAAGLPAGEFLRLEFVFTARGNATSPVLHGYQIERVCTGVLN